MHFPGKNTFAFADLFVFEMANNHQGIREHGLRIINAMADLAERRGARGAVKLQLRDLDTFIHPQHRQNSSNKHIGRFLSTRLSEEDFAVLAAEIKRRGLLAIATPFDEASVDLCERLGVDVIKVASCSVQDWPLLERIAETGKSVIASIGGLAIPQADKLVSFFQHRGVEFALMHCVAEYPTPNDRLHLNHIATLRNRYPGITIGFSTHEEPGNTNAIRVAYAKGARLFEKHVGIPTDEIKLNAYSAAPEQVDAWLSAWREARDACGPEAERPVSAKEHEDLRSLMRGVFAKRDIRPGSVIARSDVFFAMPIEEGQLASGDWREGLIADRNYAAHQPLAVSLSSGALSKKDVIYSTIHAVKGMLNEARIPVGHEFSVEISHHYGIERFRDVGCVIIDCFNREYARKLIIQLPGQWHPVHYHKTKDETFCVLRGEMEVEIEGRRKVLTEGDTLWVPRGVWHAFGTAGGAVVEEISTTNHPDDSFYIDRTIARMNRDERKTRLVNWGRHQFDHIAD